MAVEKQRTPAFELVDQIESRLRQDEALAEPEREDLLTDVEMVRAQLRKREPNRPALAAVLEPLSQVASIAGHVANLIRMLNA